MNEVRVKLADGSERVGRWVTLDEWMAPLDKDHPARKELFALRMNLGSAMAQIDKLERLNASLHQQFIEEMAKQEQPKENEPVQRSPDDQRLLRKPKIPRRLQAHNDAGNPPAEEISPDLSAD